MNRHARLSFFSAFFAIIMMLLLTACGSTTGVVSTGGKTVAVLTASTPPLTRSNDNGTMKQVRTSHSNSTSTNTSTSMVPLKVTGVDMAVNPPTLRNYTCGTGITETYTATFHFPTHNVGGPVKFDYTTNNGRASEPASLVVRPGQTSTTYAFSWSGRLPSDNTAPGLGGVMVTFPNAYTSQLLAPLGPCKPAPLAPFHVNSISLSASPALTGHSCGSFFTETYTATFHIAPGGPGGTIVFQYTTTNGRSSSSNVSLNVFRGQTTATYVFKWSGTLDASHTAPGIGIVMISSPDQMISPSVAPVGVCY